MMHKADVTSQMTQQGKCGNSSFELQLASILQEITEVVREVDKVS